MCTGRPGAATEATEDWSFINEVTPQLQFQANAGWFLALGRSRILLYQARRVSHFDPLRSLTSKVEMSARR